MPTLETQALVLEGRPYRETSLLVSLLTRERGRVAAIAKGARRRKPMLASALQPYALIEARLLIGTSGGLANLTGADVVAMPDYARAGRGVSLDRIAYAGLFAEVLTHAHEGDPHAEELFALSRRFFLGLDRCAFPGSFALHGLFALLGAFGFGLALPEANAATPGKVACTIDLLEGRFIAADTFALREEPSAARSARFPVSAEAFEALRAILSAGATETPEPVNRRLGRDLMRLAIALFETHLESRLRSAKFLEEMVFSNANS